MSARFSKPTFGVDGTAPIPIASLHGAGGHFTYRYVSRSSWKVLRPGEFQNNEKNGIATAIVFEDEADAALKGYERGKQDAEFSRNQLQALTGHAGPIVFAVDIDPNVYAQDRFDDYFNGCAAVLGHENCGPYGGFKVIAHHFDRGFKRGWQTYAWSGNQFDLRAQVIQYSNAHTVGGQDVDFDHAYYEDYNQIGWKFTPVDPNHYSRYDTVPRTRLAPRPWLTHPTELEVVKLYDKYRAQQRRLRHPNRKQLDILRHQCAWFFGRLREEAHVPHGGGWTAFHRGWRGQQLYHRYKGERVAK